MSDRAATGLDRLIEDVRTEILPVVMAGYEELNEEKQSDVGHLLVFSCGSQTLVHFAECCNISLVEAEKGTYADKVPTGDLAMINPCE